VRRRAGRGDVRAGAPRALRGVLRQAQFLRDFDAGRFREEILQEYQEAHARYGITAIPTVIMTAAADGRPPRDDGVKITGAVPRAEYEQVLAARFGLRPLAGAP
jgi:predicted DsbA family dithiol-disulfide isomerase